MVKMNIFFLETYHYNLLVALDVSFYIYSIQFGKKESFWTRFGSNIGNINDE
jgi:hypothetical protein